MESTPRYVVGACRSAAAAVLAVAVLAGCQGLVEPPPVAPAPPPPTDAVPAPSAPHAPAPTTPGTDSSAPAPASSAAPSDPAPRAGAKLIAVDQETPSAAYLRDSIAQLQERPFDGLSFTLGEDPALAFDDRRWTEQDVPVQTVADISWGRIQDNFVQVWGQSPTGAGWFDDARWETVRANTTLLSQALTPMQVRGITFDPEFYGADQGAHPWTYSAAQYPGQGFDQVQAKVRQRGAEYMTALQSAKPNVAVLSYWLMSTVYQDVEVRGQALQDITYALLPAFVNGMLDTAGPDVRIIDGHESSYYYTQVEDFGYAENWIRNQSAAMIAPEHRDRYQQGVVGLAVSPDCIYGLYPFEVCQQGLSEDQMQQRLTQNVQQSLATTDEFVWMWNEEHALISPDESDQPLPSGLLDAIRAGRTAAGF